MAGRRSNQNKGTILSNSNVSRKREPRQDKQSIRLTKDALACAGEAPDADSIRRAWRTYSASRAVSNEWFESMGKAPCPILDPRGATRWRTSRLPYRVLIAADQMHAFERWARRHDVDLHRPPECDRQHLSRDQAEEDCAAAGVPMDHVTISRDGLLKVWSAPVMITHPSGVAIPNPNRRIVRTISRPEIDAARAKYQHGISKARRLPRPTSTRRASRSRSTARHSPGRRASSRASTTARDDGGGEPGEPAPLPARERVERPSAAAPVGRPPTQRNRAEELILHELACFGPQSVAKIDGLLTQAGISTPTRTRTQRMLGLDLYRQDGRWWLRIPDDALKSGEVVTLRLPGESPEDQAARHMKRVPRTGSLVAASGERGAS